MKGISGGPIGVGAEALATGARAAAQHTANNVEARAQALRQDELDVQTEVLLANGADTDALVAASQARAAREQERTRQVEAVQGAKKNRNKGLLIGIGLFSGSVAIAGAAIGGSIAFSAYEASHTVNHAVDKIGNGLGSIGNGITKAFSEQNVSAVEIQNVVTGFEFPNELTVERASLEGSTNVHVQGQFLGIQAWQGKDIPATVCGDEEVIVYYQDPGVQVSADRNASGNPELVLQLPLSAIKTQFVPKMLRSSDGSLVSACPQSVPTSGELVSVGPTAQENVALYEENQLISACVVPTRNVLDSGIINSLHGIFKFGAESQNAVAAESSLTPQEMVTVNGIKGILPTIPIRINYVTVANNGAAAYETAYQPADMANYTFGFPSAPSKSQLANTLREDQSHITLPPQKDTQCLMTALAVNEYQSGLNNNSQQEQLPSSQPMVGATQ